MFMILGVSGGIAAYKAALLLRLFKEAGHEVRVMPTPAALEFVGAPTWEALSGLPVTTSVFEDVDSVAHVALGDRAELIVVAPATADLIARIAAGRSNDLLTASILTATCPVVLAPAMHTQMWQNPATVANIATLKSRGIIIIEPASGRLTGADTGVGRLPDPEDIFTQALAHVVGSQGAKAQDLAGKKVLISGGGTQEALDPVRFLGNRSSGLQAAALAQAALSRGAEVTLVAGTVQVALPDGAEVVAVTSAEEMRVAMAHEAPDADIVIMAAAVADFRPSTVTGQKIKKTDDDQTLTLVLEKTTDILAELVAQRNRKRQDGPVDQKIIGFAAETGDEGGDVLFHGRQKAKRKGADLLVINEVGQNLGFGQPTNSVTIVTATGDIVGEKDGTKDEIAHAILDQILKLN